MFWRFKNISLRGHIIRWKTNFKISAGVSKFFFRQSRKHVSSTSQTSFFSPVARSRMRRYYCTRENRVSDFRFDFFTDQIYCWFYCTFSFFFFFLFVFLFYKYLWRRYYAEYCRRLFIAKNKRKKTTCDTFPRSATDLFHSYKIFSSMIGLPYLFLGTTYLHRYLINKVPISYIIHVFCRVAIGGWK